MRRKRVAQQSFRLRRRRYRMKRYLKRRRTTRRTRRLRRFRLFLRAATAASCRYKGKLPDHVANELREQVRAQRPAHVFARNPRLKHRYMKNRVKQFVKANHRCRPRHQSHLTAVAASARRALKRVRSSRRARLQRLNKRGRKANKKNRGRKMARPRAQRQKY